jgi:mannose-1-phosphate guanylyltransferase
LPEVSIDRGVVEKAAEQRAPIIVVKASFGWDDVGTWEAAAKYLGRDASGNRVQGRHVGLETRNCILVGGKRLIATLGIEDLVVVESDDAILVCRREVVERVRELVEELERRGETEVL